MQNYSKITPQIHIETLGCRLNQIESESVAKCFTDSAFSVEMDALTASSEERSEILISIVNTCTVTQKAEQKARRIFRLILRKFPETLLVVTGCYAQLSKNEIEKIDPRIVVLGGQKKSRLKEVPEILNGFLKTNKWNPLQFKQIIENQVFELPQQKQSFPENSFALSTSSFISHSRASLKIQDGCNNNCSYCAIHIARGHSVSLPVEQAVKRVQELEDKGINEVVITTVNIGQYKSEYNGVTYNFTKLLKLLLESTKNINFRISSLYPEVVDDEFCEVIKDSRVCPHFHISVQSGSNAVLKNMNRVYKREDVIKACEKLQQVKQNLFLACDIITGFPGETDSDFEMTMDLCRQCNFTWIHAFPYSERPGTAAALMKNKVPQSVSGERVKQLNQWAVQQKIAFVKANCGIENNAILEVLRKPQYVYHCVTDNFIHCEIFTEKDKSVIPAGTKVKVQIIDVQTEKIQKGGEIEAVASII